MIVMIFALVNYNIISRFRHCKDIIILTAIVLVLAMFSEWLWLILLLVSVTNSPESILGMLDPLISTENG